MTHNNGPYEKVDMSDSDNVFGYSIGQCNKVPLCYITSQTSLKFERMQTVNDPKNNKSRTVQ